MHHVLSLNLRWPGCLFSVISMLSGRNAVAESADPIVAGRAAFSRDRRLTGLPES